MKFLARLSEPWAAVIVGAIGFATAGVTYYLAESAKLDAESYSRRAEKYEELLSTATSFYVGASDLPSRRTFLAELDQCWLYCPDDVLRAGYGFLDTVKTGTESTADERAKAFGALVLMIRRDLIAGERVSATTMQPSEYRLFYANP